MMPAGASSGREPASRDAAQLAADRIAVFQQELAHLEAAGVLHLSTEQQQAVDKYHQMRLEQWRFLFDVDTHHQDRQFSLGMKITSYLAALGLGAAIFFLFYQFWGHFSTTWQVSLLFTASIGSLLACMHFAAREQTGYFSQLLGTVAFVCFVLNLVLLGQIFNIPPTHRVLLAWAAFAFVVAYATGARLLLSVAVLCLAGFLSAQIGMWNGMHWLDAGGWPELFFPAAALFFVLSQLPHQLYPAFPSLYRIWALLFWFLPVFVLAHWGAGSFLLLPSQQVEWLYQVAGFATGAGVIVLGIRRNFSETVQIGVMFCTVSFYSKLYDWWWDWMPKYLFFFLCGLVAILVLLVLRRLRVQSVQSFRTMQKQETL